MCYIMTHFVVDGFHVEEAGKKHGVLPGGYFLWVLLLWRLQVMLLRVYCLCEILCCFL